MFGDLSVKNGSGKREEETAVSDGGGVTGGKEGASGSGFSFMADGEETLTSGVGIGAAAVGKLAAGVRQREILVLAYSWRCRCHDE